MSIVIDRTSENDNQLIAFDNSFNDFLYQYISDITFTDTTKHLTNDIQLANTSDQVFIPNPDIFKALAISKDLDMIIHSELVKTYDSNNQRIIYYTVNIDYHPLSCQFYSNHIMNILLNLQEHINPDDDTSRFVGQKYSMQEYFTISNPTRCVMQKKPSVKKIDYAKASYLRQEIDFIFLVSLDINISVCTS